MNAPIKAGELVSDADTRLAQNLRYYANNLDEIIDDVIGSRGEADDSLDCFECALIKLRDLRTDLLKKSVEVGSGEHAEQREAAE